MSSKRCAPGPDEADPRCEEGRIGVLMAACLMIVAVFVLVSSALTAVAIEDRRLVSCADRVASGVAGLVSGPSLYTTGEDSRGSAQEQAEYEAPRVLDSLLASTCRVGRGVELESVSMQGQWVRVEVSARAVFPFIPVIAADLAAPTLVRESVSQVGARS